MNYFLLTLLAIAAVVSIVILILFIILLGVWMKGSSVVALPGLGIIVATPLALVYLLVAEIVMVFIAAYLARLVFGE